MKPILSGSFSPHRALGGTDGNSSGRCEGTGLQRLCGAAIRRDEYNKAGWGLMTVVQMRRELGVLDPPAGPLVPCLSISGAGKALVHMARMFQT